jgi:hypothetical protein
VRASCPLELYKLNAQQLKQTTPGTEDTEKRCKGQFYPGIYSLNLIG